MAYQTSWQTLSACTKKTHGFHWNVTGPMFQTLHLMFMEQYTDLWNSIDVIAERIRALGEYAPFGGDAMKKTDHNLRLSFASSSDGNGKRAHEGA